VAVKAPYVQRQPAHYAVQSLDRAIDLLEVFQSGEDERGVAELGRALDLPRATVHRLLAALSHRGLLVQNEQTGKYRLGFKLFELGSMVGESLDVRRVARPCLVDLVRQSGETAHLVVLDGVDVVFVDKVETDNPFRMVSQLGRRLPACHSGSGKALLARLSEDELVQRYPSTPGHVSDEVDLPLLRRQLAEARRRGYALDDQETQAGLRCVGAVVFDFAGTAVAGLSISGPIVRIGDDRVPELARLVCAAAAAVSRGLGYRVPNPVTP
jgi:IclR family transcriptional regulator, KDG regulon repressor